MRFNYQTVTNKILSNPQVDDLIGIIDDNEYNRGFGVRNFLDNNLEVLSYLRNSNRFIELIKENFENPKIIKSIYFDKPKKSNWAVNWHQDITINLTKKLDLKNYINWRVLQDRVVVQPDIEVLKSVMTYRIHLDDTDESNGALKIVWNSDQLGVIRIDSKFMDEFNDDIKVCNVERGGITAMRPLTVHASQRSKDNQKRRRVIHLEIIEAIEDQGLPWKEEYLLS